MQLSRPTIVGVLAASVLCTLTGCSSGATATSTPTQVASSQRASVAPATPSRTPTPSATPEEQRVKTPGPAPLGFRTQQGAGQFQINTVSWQRTANGKQAAPPKESYLVLEVTFTATEGTVLVNPLYLHATTKTGGTVSPTMGSDGNEPVLAGRRLNPGESVSGVIVFDVPRVPAAIQLTDELDNKIAEITLLAPPN